MVTPANCPCPERTAIHNCLRQQDSGRWFTLGSPFVCPVVSPAYTGRGLAVLRVEIERVGRKGVSAGTVVNVEVKRILFSCLRW